MSRRQNGLIVGQIFHITLACCPRRASARTQCPSAFKCQTCIFASSPTAAIAESSGAKATPFRGASVSTSVASNSASVVRQMRTTPLSSADARTGRRCANATHCTPESRPVSGDRFWRLRRTLPATRSQICNTPWEVPVARSGRRHPISPEILNDRCALNIDCCHANPRFPDIP